jgi:hypothetical protein
LDFLTHGSLVLTSELAFQGFKRTRQKTTKRIARILVYYPFCLTLSINQVNKASPGSERKDLDDTSQLKVVDNALPSSAQSKYQPHRVF